MPPSSIERHGEIVAGTENVDPGQAYYYNLETGKVERGLVSDWTDRLGPYRTHDEAANALELARQRNEAWEEQDREWDDDPED